MKEYNIAEGRAILKPLIGDLLVRFVRKATAAMHQTNNVLVPSSTRPDSFRIASLAEVAAAIPEDMYTEWGLPLQCRSYVTKNLTELSRPISAFLPS